MVTRLSDEDTIVAIATPPGEGGIGIVRLSGARAVEIADSFFRAKSARTLARQSAGSLLFGRVVVQDGSKEGRTVDEVLALVMRGPRSYTREDVVEIHAHGGTAVLRKILELAYRFGARAAEKGEFTKRAFLNGRLDLIQAEAVADLIRAKTDLARQWASAQLGGALSATLRGLRDELLDVLSQLEASIDFSEEEIAPASLEEIRARLDHTAKSLQKTLTGAEAGLLVKRGLGVAIYGRPNTGKSSLLNRLTGIDRAIVTPHAGTTRDVVEAEMQIRGLVLRLSDTAGVQETSNPIERQGVERSKKAVLAADLVLLVVDQSRSWSQDDQQLLEGLPPKKTIIVLNKSDLSGVLEASQIERLAGIGPVVKCSCLSVDGVEGVATAIYSMASAGTLEVPEDAVVGSVRQKDLVEKALQAVENARQCAQDNPMPDLISVDVRLALDYLGLLVGEVFTEDLLDSIFSQFCIGK